MADKRKTICLALLAAFSLMLLGSCAVLQDMATALGNLQRLRFKLGAVHDFELLGINLSGKSRLNQFTAMDGVRLLQAFQSRRLPAAFVLDVLAVNPNDGTGGSPKTVSTLTGLESRLLIDGTPTVSGNIDRPVEIPGTGQESVIPIRLSIDLLEFFGEKKYNDLLNLALAIGGANQDGARLALDAQPRVSTPYGALTYPGRLTIVSREFR
ncbi:MAG: hypothetical protein FJY83_07720 [Candidatus Aminicenantes bacterium]|nr:hypothetical protein [Candidatus Aminicenantes bacterium]